MILSEKIVAIRKKYGWSQEELAEKLEVSRQSVSKWEIGAAIPDLDKIVKLSTLTGISTDYLLKDDADDSEFFGSEAVPGQETVTNDGTVSLDAANEFLSLNRLVAKRVALGIVLIILSPFMLMFSEGLGQTDFFHKNADPLTAPSVPEEEAPAVPEIPELEDENLEAVPDTISYMPVGFSVNGLDGNSFGYNSLIPSVRARGVGALFFLLFVAGGLFLVIFYSLKLNKYKEMNREIFSLSYGVEGIVTKRKKEFDSSFNMVLTIGIVLCALPVLPALLEYLNIINRMSQVVVDFYACASLILVAVGLYLITSSCIVRNSYNQILQTGNYTPDKKAAGKAGSGKLGFYWMAIGFLFIAVSYVFKNWDKTWIIWPIAVVIYIFLNQIFGKIEKKK